MVKVDLSGAKVFFDPAGPDYALAAEAHRKLFGQSAAENRSVGWLDLPQRIIDSELKHILTAADKIKRQSRALVVVCIGAAYHASRAAIELLQTPNHNQISGETEVYFLGATLSPDSINELVALLGDKDFSVNLICLSEDKPEVYLGFRVAKSLLERKYGRSGARRRISVTAGETCSALLSFARAEAYDLFTLPADIDERFCTLSAAALLPMAVAGIDIKTVLEFAAAEMRSLAVGSPENPAWQYAAARQHLYRRGKNIEILSSFEPSFRCFAQWWKLMFAESEGKNSIGIFPAYAEYPADIFSMGQYIQDGPRSIVETNISFENSLTEYKVPFEMGDPDGMNYLAGRGFSELLNASKAAIRAAHTSGGVPNICISVPYRNEAGYAALVCFFQVASCISAYMSGVNPFDSNGLKEYVSSFDKLLRQ